MNQCSNCGTFVTPDFVRVFGDNANQVERCPACTTMTEATDETAGSDRDRGGGWW
jgi:hypothetical protein